MGDSTVPPHLGFVKESERQPMEIEGGCSGSAEALGRRGKKRPPSPRGDEEVEDSPTTMDPDDDWFVSDSGSEEEEGDDDGNQGKTSKTNHSWPLTFEILYWSFVLIFCDLLCRDVSPFYN